MYAACSRQVQPARLFKSLNASNFPTMKGTLLILFLTLLSGSAFSQLVTTSNLTVEQYVQQVLLGQNVSVSNITFNGGSANVVSASVGGFDCVDCNMSIPSGFAMTTGDVAGLVGPNSVGGFAGTGTGGMGRWAGASPSPNPGFQRFENRGLGFRVRVRVRVRV